MYKNEFQGGNFFEIFNPTQKDPLSSCKQTGSHGIQKIYEKEVKGSIYQLEGTPATTKISFPKESKHGLSLIQRCIVFQINVRENQEFSMELGITDLCQTRRNLLFSTAHKELNIQPLSARIPIKFINRSQWTNLAFDLASLISDIWKNQTFKAIDSIAICANCKLRKIFTLKNLPNSEYGLNADDSLTSVDFPEGTNSKLQIFSLIESKSNNQADSNNVNNQKSKAQTQNLFKIAFGSKIPKVPPITTNTSTHTIKSAKSQTQIDQSDLYELSLKSNGFTPLSLSNGHLSTNEFIDKQNFTLTDRSNFLENSNLNLSAKSNQSNSLNQSDSLLQQKNKLQENRLNSSKTNWNQRATSKAALSAKSTTQSNSFNKSTHLLPLESQQNSTININSIDASNKKSLLIANDSASNTSTSKTPKPNTSNKNAINQNEIPINSNSNSAIKNVKLENIIQSNKIPHPPPQSTRPTSSSARKIRLSSVVKTNTNVQESQPANYPKPNIGNFTNGDSSNEEDIHNSSSKTIFDYNANQVGSIPSFLNAYSNTNISSIKPINNNESNMFNESITELVQILKTNGEPINQNGRAPQPNSIDSTNSIAYSFSSKPKPLTVNNKDFASTNSTSNTTSKTYDYRKYLSSGNNLSSNKLNSITKLNKIASENPNNMSFLKDSLNPPQDSNDYNNINNNDLNNFSNNLGENQNFYNDLMDSFEAQMLQDMKAEMESDSKTSSKTKNSGSSQVNSNETKKLSKIQSDKLFHIESASKMTKVIDEKQNNTNKPNLTEFQPKLNPKSPDADYVEAIQREASGIQSPLSDDYNQTTSEKYNFDAMTSSIEDTTTSLSKKTSNRKTRYDESNNYQDEMNVSLQSNVPAKSINFKDLPMKYSPLMNHQQQSMNKLQKIPIDEINEEPTQYDDSQADIDEIISDSDEEIDLLYDPSLNCYYDPKTGTYYELNLS